MRYYIVPSQTIPYHTIPYHIISYHFISYHISQYRAGSHHVVYIYIHTYIHIHTHLYTCMHVYMKRPQGGLGAVNWALISKQILSPKSQAAPPPPTRKAILGEGLQHARTFRLFLLAGSWLYVFQRKLQLPIRRPCFSGGLDRSMPWPMRSQVGIFQSLVPTTVN